MASYTTLDYLPDLTASKKNNALDLPFKPETDSSYAWENVASTAGIEPYALSHHIYKTEFKEGATYSITSISFFDPFILIIYDKEGNAIEANSESDDPTGLLIGDTTYEVDMIYPWVAPYSGEYYVAASWNQGSYYTLYGLSLHEYTDTITKVAEPVIENIPTIASEVTTTPQENNINHTNHFLVYINKPLSTDMTVEYRTKDGTATAGEDYTASTGTATIKAGDTSVAIGIEIIGDTEIEADETFSMEIYNPSIIENSTSNDLIIGVATHTIMNDDF
jgi:hypothetical protein